MGETGMAPMANGQDSHDVLPYDTSQVNGYEDQSQNPESINDSFEMRGRIQYQFGAPQVQVQRNPPQQKPKSAFGQYNYQSAQQKAAQKSPEEIKEEVKEDSQE